MRNRKIIYISILVLFIVSLILAGMIWYGKNQELKIIFLDVGQGDAILIEQGSNQILIDGGPSGQILMEKLGKYVPFWDREIEAVIATHPDQDHIEGLAEVVKNYKVDALFEGTEQSESQLYKNYEALLNEKQIQKVLAVSGVKIKLAQAEMEILSPRGVVPTSVVSDTNAYSVVAKLSFGQNSFLFTGDFPDSEERKILQENVDLSARVLKVAHHGSKYASSAEFLDKVHPQDAIISVGQKNRFGHPTPETLTRLQERSINIFRTDESGDVEYDCPNFESKCTMFAK